VAVEARPRHGESASISVSSSTPVASHSIFRARPLSLTAAPLLALALLAGCGGGGDDNETTTATAAGGGGGGAAKPGVYVGEVEGTSDAIALVTDGNRLTGAFLCIPDSTSQWIRPAPLQDGQAPLVARRGVNLGTAKFAGDTATGTVNAGGQNSFSAKVASGYAGLYRVTSGNADNPPFSETGWVLLPDGTVCGGTNTLTADGGFTSGPAPSKPQGGGRVTNFANPFPF
jgi:hypothetical protein